jgi:hypothetical protein
MFILYNLLLLMSMIYGRLYPVMSGLAERLAEERLTQLDRIYGDSNFLIIGSIGRAAIMTEPLPSPFDKRGAGLRDIDVFDPIENLECTEVIDLGPEFTHVTGPFGLDSLLHGWLKHEGEAHKTVYLSYPNTDEIAVEIPHSLLEPTERPVEDGIIIRTFGDELQLYIELMRGRVRPSDEDAVSRYSAQVKNRHPQPNKQLGAIFAEHRRQIRAKRPLHFPLYSLLNSVGGGTPKPPFLSSRNLPLSTRRVEHAQQI